MLLGGLRVSSAFTHIQSFLSAMFDSRDVILRPPSLSVLGVAPKVVGLGRRPLGIGEPPPRRKTSSKPCENDRAGPCRTRKEKSFVKERKRCVEEQVERSRSPPTSQTRGTSSTHANPIPPRTPPPRHLLNEGGRQEALLSDLAHMLSTLKRRYESGEEVEDLEEKVAEMRAQLDLICPRR